jgi:hypothetical protein
MTSLKDKKIFGNEGLKFDLSGTDYDKFKYAGVSASVWLEKMKTVIGLLGMSEEDKKVVNSMA